MKLVLLGIAGLLAAASPVAASPPLAIVDGHLTEIDDRTLLPRGEPLLTIPEFHGTASVAPDRQRIAVGMSDWSSTGKTARIGAGIFDLRTRAFTEVPTGIAAEDVAWFAPDRIAALLQTGHVVVVNARTGRVLRRHLVAKFRCTHAAAITGSRAVFLAAGRGTVARLAVVRADGTVRSVSLPSVRYGRPGSTCQRRALVVGGGRAFVSSAGTGSITDVQLDTLQVTSRPVRGLPGSRLRELAWIGGNRLAVAGTNAAGPAGAVVVDTQRWRARPLDRRASGAIRISRLVVTFAGGAARRPVGQRPGVRAFGVDDLRRRWSRPTAAPVWDIQAAVGQLFARSNTTISVLDPATGRVLAQPRYPHHGDLLFIG